MFLQTVISCREQRCVFWITSSMSLIRVTCSSNSEWVVGQSMVCLQQSPEDSSDEAEAFWLFAKCLTWAGMYQGWMCLQPVHGRRCPALLRHIKGRLSTRHAHKVYVKFKYTSSTRRCWYFRCGIRTSLLLSAALNLSFTSRAPHSHKGRKSLLTMTCWYLKWSGASRPRCSGVCQLVGNSDRF